MNKNFRLQIAYSCNDKMFDGLYLSILSILKRTKHPIDFLFFSASLPELNKKFITLTKKHEKAIRELIAKYGNNSTFKIFDCKENYYKRSQGKLPNTRHWTPYTAFRLLFDMYDEIKGLVLYLDTDTMACDDIAKAFDVDMTNYELCATKDIIVWDEALKDTYFNAGVILMNLDLIRKTGYLEKAFKYLLEKNPKMCDQDALNKTCKSVLIRNDDRFNRILEYRNNDTVIKHFAGPCPKPWYLSFTWKYKKYNYSVWKDDIHQWRKMKLKIKFFK